MGTEKGEIFARKRCQQFVAERPRINCVQ
jgi:hypothetical protein